MTRKSGHATAQRRRQKQRRKRIRQYEEARHVEEDNKRRKEDIAQREEGLANGPHRVKIEEDGVADFREFICNICWSERDRLARCVCDDCPANSDSGQQLFGGQDQVTSHCGLPSGDLLASCQSAHAPISRKDQVESTSGWSIPEDRLTPTNSEESLMSDGGMSGTRSTRLQGLYEISHHGGASQILSHSAGALDWDHHLLRHYGPPQAFPPFSNID